jgi:hypothetical protein
MNDEWLAGGSGCRYVGAKPGLLHDGAIRAAKIVEARFTDGDHSIAGRCETHKRARVRIDTLLLVRMHTYRGKKMVVSVGQCDDTMQVLQIHRDAQGMGHPGPLHRPENFGKAGLKLGKIKVAVGVDDRGWHGAYMV